MKNYKVYLLKDRLEDKIVYCGITRTSLQRRFDAHVSQKKLDRKKYTIELVTDYLTQIEAALLERMLIKQYNLLKTGFNKSPGSIDGNSQEHSEEQKRKWSLERKGKPVSEEHAAKNRIARLGKKNSLEHNKKLLEGICKPIVCLETGIIYKSARDAAKQLNLCYSKISLVCNGKRTTTGNLHFKFIEKR